MVNPEKINGRSKKNLIIDPGKIPWSIQNKYMVDPGKIPGLIQKITWPIQIKLHRLLRSNLELCNHGLCHIFHFPSHFIRASKVVHLTPNPLCPRHIPYASVLRIWGCCSSSLVHFSIHQTQSTIFKMTKTKKLITIFVGATYTSWYMLENTRVGRFKIFGNWLSENDTLFV